MGQVVKQLTLIQKSDSLQHKCIKMDKMTHLIEDKTLLLAQTQDYNLNEQNGALHIVDAILATHPKLMKLEETYEWGLWAGRWTLFWIGTYFKCVLYSHLWDKYKKREFKPIDLLILVTSVVQHLNSINLIYNGLLVMLFDISSEQLVKEWVCTLPRLLFQFEICYSCIGSLGVSIFRIIYIKNHLWVKYCLGEKKILTIILFGGFAVTVVCMLLLSYNDYERIFKETCLLSPSVPLLEELDEYEQSRGNDSIYLHWIQCRRILFIILVCVTLAELIIYIIFFQHMYQHDNSVNLRVLLESKAIRRRNQRNAITFFGQFCSFAFEIGLNIIMISAVEGNASWGVVILFKMVAFTSMAIIEDLTSASLRRILI